MHLAGVRTYGAESSHHRLGAGRDGLRLRSQDLRQVHRHAARRRDHPRRPAVDAGDARPAGRLGARGCEAIRPGDRDRRDLAGAARHPGRLHRHTPRRSAYDEIAEQQVHLGIDVVLGGGRRYLLPPSAGGTRADGEDLVAVLRARGTTFVETREAMLASAGPRLWGAFARDDMAHELDRPAVAPDQPSLAEMTRKAIKASPPTRAASSSSSGSKATRPPRHDPAGVVGDVLAFDAAVGVALDFDGTRGDTLVLAFADHSTGGMSLGSHATDRTYAKLPAAALVAPLKAATITAEGVARLLAGPRDEAAIRRALAATASPTRRPRSWRRSRTPRTPTSPRSSARCSRAARRSAGRRAATPARTSTCTTTASTGRSGCWRTPASRTCAPPRSTSTSPR